ncbi:porin family protein [Vibrio sp. ABG19]|uniref:porin family protein n=1 Tax=Vibrio sp. ABG19 TaxID=2817385 RepID=UPI00249E8C49|nr:porin family protein [Vibrio sp. ABG19]WGY47442.1 porin family protein [Vibrio sp. ABG19]
MRSLQFIVFVFGCWLSATATADVYLTPSTGYALGGKVEDNTGQSYDLNASSTLAITLEVPFQTGRVGLFYARQSTDVDIVEDQATLHYLLFQSRINYQLESNWSSYLGAGLGASYFDASWVGNKSGFAASIFTGLDYHITSSVALSSQIRWLGTVVDNETSALCSLPEPGRCIVRFQSDWMNQFSANLGLTIRF